MFSERSIVMANDYFQRFNYWNEGTLTILEMFIVKQLQVKTGKKCAGC
jgi:hypothetical protein